MCPLPLMDSFSLYGGKKTDYSQPVNNSTDWSATNVNSAFAATAQMSRTSPRAEVRFVAGSSPTLATVNSYESVWRADTTTLPIVAHTGTGVYTITLPATVVDPLGNTINVNLRFGQVSLEGSTFSGLVQYSITAANVVTVYTANLAGTANDLTGVTVSVMVA